MRSSAALAASPSMDGLDLASAATIPNAYSEGPRAPNHHVVAFDFGMKRNILRLFVQHGCRVTGRARANNRRRDARAETGRRLPVPTAPATRGRRLRDRYHSDAGGWESCRSLASALGHQLLGLAMGGETVKLPYGHRGGNHPVRDVATGQVLITSQNHGFAVRERRVAFPGAKSLEVTHLNLNDGTVEGIKHREYQIFCCPVPPGGLSGPT